MTTINSSSNPMMIRFAFIASLCSIGSVTAFSSITPPGHRGGGGVKGFHETLGDEFNQMMSEMSDNTPEMPKMPEIEIPEMPEFEFPEMLENVSEGISEMLEEGFENVSEGISDMIEEGLESVSEGLSEMIEEGLDRFPLPAFLRPTRAAGGRAPDSPDKVSSSDEFDMSPASPSEARLIVVQITDVYTLEYFAHLKTLLEDVRAKADGCKVVCMLTGDFLSPYLLSSVDRGYGMMHALANSPIDYLSWGNHEADIEHRTVCRHVRNFPGKWINSNMLDHEAMDCQQEYDVINLSSPDGSNKRKVGLCAVLSDDAALYSHFEAPGAFGGATITDPWEALTKYKKILEEDEGCDMVLPLQHTYVPDDHKTCKDFDFPLILSGHDHHRVDEVIDGTRLIKPGMNGVHAAVVEISWPDNASGAAPQIRSKFVKTGDWAANEQLAEECERAYDALTPLRNTELDQVPTIFEPLSSGDSRGSVCTMGKYICTSLRMSLNMSRKQRRHSVDAVLLMGGNIRGNAEYELGSYFSLEALEAEVKSDEVVGIVGMPGWLLAKGIEETHSGDPIPGWMQYDQGVHEDYSGDTPKVTHVAGTPIDLDRVYRVATKISDLTNGQSPSWTEYYTEKKNLLPPVGSYVNIHAELMPYFARKVWRKLWVAISDKLKDVECGVDGEECGPEDRLEILDSNGSGVVTVEDIQAGLRDLLGLSIDDNEMSLARFVHSFADSTGDGQITKKDFQVFCNEMVEENEMLPVDIPQLEVDPQEAEAMLKELRAVRDELDIPSPAAITTSDEKEVRIELGAEEIIPPFTVGDLGTADADEHILSPAGQVPAAAAKEVQA